MIYLIMKMFVYLAVALAAGFGAGWLTRNLVAVKKEEELQRTLSDTKSRLPQFESLMRSRDEQSKTLRQEVKEKDARIGELHEQMGIQDRTLRAKDRELKSAQHRLAAYDVDAGATNSDGGASELDTELSDVDMTGGPPLDYAGVEERLRQQQQSLEVELRSARGDPTKPSLASGASSAMEDVLRIEVHELESRLRQTVAEHDRFASGLEREERKVVELQRERELQNKSIQVLHQQLELARENGQQTAGG